MWCSSRGYSISVLSSGGQGAPNLHFFVLLIFLMHVFECLCNCKSMYFFSFSIKEQLIIELIYSIISVSSFFS